MTKLLPYRINWKDPFEEAYAYKTEVITSRDKTEQRIAWRSQPRLSVSYKASPVRSDVRGLWNHLRFDMGEKAVVPKVTAPMRLSAPATDDILSIDGPLPAWATVGKYLVVDHKTRLELLRISAVTGSSITLEAPLSAPLATGSAVYQGLTGALDQTMKATLLTTHASNLSVDFMADPGDNVYFSEDDPSFEDMLDGYPLLLLKPNWAQGVNLNAIGFLETTDFDIGRIEHNVDSFIGYSDVSVRGGYTLMNSEAIEKMKRLFHKLKGQQKPFLVPSWIESSIDVSGGISAGGTTLYVPGTDLHESFTGNSEFYHGTITFFQGGAVQPNTVASTTVRLSGNGLLAGFCLYRGSETTSDGTIGTLTEYLIIPQGDLPDWEVGDRIVMVSTTNPAGFQAGEITALDPDYGIEGTALVTVAVDSYSASPVTDDVWVIAPEDAVGPTGWTGYGSWPEYLADAPRETVVVFSDPFDQGIPSADQGGTTTRILPLVKARFLVDTLTLSFQTATVATTQLTYKPMKETME